MSFPEAVAAEALAACERRCYICHKFCGRKIELHHIKQKADGENSSGHSSKCTSVSTENTTNSSGMKTALEEFAKNFSKKE